MRFLVDMCMDVRVAQWLKDQGYDASHLRDEGLQRLANGDIFNRAISENRTILTFDLDFGEIAALSKQKKTSVIVFRLNNTRVTHVIDRLKKILPILIDTLKEGAIVIIEESRHRVRELPISIENRE